MRTTTKEEKEKLHAFYMVLFGMNGEEIRDAVSLEYSGVIDNYITDGPVYSGKLYIVISSGSPGIHDVIIETGDTLQLVSKENIDVPKGA